jgi:uncharacterized protein YifE (UPF0438 family)
MKNNKPIIITGEQYIERLADSQSRDDHDSNNESQEYAFGYKNLEITVNGNTSRISKDDDKFIAYGTSIQEAREEFWARWSKFVKRAYNRNFIKILNNQ